MTPGERMTKTTDKIKDKCMSCYFGRKEHAQRVVCGHPAHPGVVGGVGSEWVLYCGKYTKVRKP